MDKSSINSLNSRRNFKLPPIQGALPATLYGERPWNINNKPASLVNGPRQPHVRIKKPIPSHDFHSLHRATLQKRTEHFPKKTTYPSSRQHTTVEINLGHDFPKSYSVLPPISKESQTQNNEISSALSASKINPVKRAARTVDKKHGTASELLSERRRERLLEKQKAQNDFNQEQDGDRPHAATEKETQSLKTAKTEETKKIVNRKPSATYLLYLKCKRNFRRGGVCPENENSLINVTEQLKEIFLRRNMEEMYLI